MTVLTQTALFTAILSDSLFVTSQFKRKRFKHSETVEPPTNIPKCIQVVLLHKPSQVFKLTQSN